MTFYSRLDGRNGIIKTEWRRQLKKIWRFQFITIVGIKIPLSTFRFAISRHQITKTLTHSSIKVFHQHGFACGKLLWDLRKR
ncbi:Uncharacterised protein [Vibrio cholerae]|nr:Uncharacterised protein [Vibrio cholerae]CSB75657.1 Uncharacterised protein [Vibrio cholerae]